MTTQRIDFDALNELKEMLEDEFVDLIDTYIRDTQTKMTQLAIDMSAGDTEAVRKLAHSMKGSSVNVGILKAGELCHQLESAAKQGQSAEFSTLKDAIDQELTWAYEQLKEIRSA